MTRIPHPDFRPNGKFIGDTFEDYVDRQRKLVKCAECGEPWRFDMLDECVACGLGAGTSGICPNCMRDHFCAGGTA